MACGLFSARTQYVVLLLPSDAAYEIRMTLRLPRFECTNSGAKCQLIILFSDGIFALFYAYF